MHRLSHEHFDAKALPRIHGCRGRFFCFDRILDATISHAIRIPDMLCARQKICYAKQNEVYDERRKKERDGNKENIHEDIVQTQHL